MIAKLHGQFRKHFIHTKPALCLLLLAIQAEGIDSVKLQFQYKH